jgi:hypothetical protein
MSAIRGGKYFHSKSDSAGPKVSYQPSGPYRGVSIYSDSFRSQARDARRGESCAPSPLLHWLKD